MQRNFHHAKIKKLSLCRYLCSTANSLSALRLPKTTANNKNRNSSIARKDCM